MQYQEARQDAQIQGTAEYNKTKPRLKRWARIALFSLCGIIFLFHLSYKLADQVQSQENLSVNTGTTNQALCQRPITITAPVSGWSKPIPAVRGCDWITRTAPSAGIVNVRKCFRTRANQDDALVVEECGTGAEAHFPQGLIVTRMEFQGIDSPVAIEIQFPRK
ncbi:MAG TPA: hypothetical protein VJH21_02110 [Candidatus Paceibacterota bacterium]